MVMLGEEWQLSSNLRRVFNIIYQPDNVESEIIYLQTHKKRLTGLNTTTCSLHSGDSALALLSVRGSSFCTNKQVNIWLCPSLTGDKTRLSPKPQIFDIAIEPLAVMLRETTSLVGVQMGGHLHKWLLYADDLILYYCTNCSRPYHQV